MTDPQTHPAGSLPDIDPAAVVEVDVRDDLRAGREPLARILAVADALAPESILHLRTPFCPTPLFGVLGARGFRHHCQPFAEDDWSTWFWRGDPMSAAISPPVARAAAPPGVLDLRALPPPQPLEAICARLIEDATPFDVMLPVYPDVLAAILAGYGWAAIVQQQGADGVWLRLQPV